MVGSSPITTIHGRGLPLRGQDIDTDRIVPARFLRSVTFEGLENCVFADERAAADRPGQPHPFSNPMFSGASVLLVNRNFGCGSSREHAPVALRRWGIQAIVGESFSEIFFANCLAMGLPCATLEAELLEPVMRRVEAEPSLLLTVNIADLSLSATGVRAPLGMCDRIRNAFTTGSWDVTSMLVDAAAETARVAGRLPYINRFNQS